MYTESRHNIPVNEWPPYHPKDYTPSVIYEEGCEIIATAENKQIQSTIPSKNISNLFSKFKGTTPYMILIEGEPGVGKTILSVEIALQWADHKILSNKKLLFVVLMHDPRMKQITNVFSLLKYFCLNNTVVDRVAEWLIETNGRYLTILLDGFDGGFVDDSTNHFIIDEIIGRKVLTECGLIITSRPAASLYLRNIVDRRAKVLGFTEEDRLSFIRDALQNNEAKIEELKECLQTNPYLNALCYSPRNMSILLCLAESGISVLPTTLTSFYENFVVVSVTHILKKKGEFAIFGLYDLRRPYDLVFRELSQFAFHALQKNQIAFTKAEVNIACPHLSQGTYFGLGLLTPTWQPTALHPYQLFNYWNYYMILFIIFVT